MPKRPDSQKWRYLRTVAGVAAAAVVVTVGALTGHVRFAHANDVVDCAQVKCVALTFDDGPTPFTDRLLGILKANDAKATFFEIGNKVAANPAGAKRVVEAGMELGSHTWEHPNMTTLPAADVPSQFSRATDAIAAATGVRPTLWRPPGGLTNAAVNEQAAKAGQAAILWDVIPFDWMNDSNTAATRFMLFTQIKPGSVVLMHDTYSSTVDLVEQFIPVLKANNYHLVTVSHLLGTRAPGSVYGSRDNGPPANALHDIPASEIPSLPHTPSPAPMPNFPITDVAGQNSGGPNNGS
ncbi:polysaccharide deacetylase family protein [Candidatus Mycobacterium wuenschmannii]|uniref:Polysaccharide deacetylase family protein n=1 Tax=Candidatus Mycobacterium wuenschmannii TaxID=3027808 RepID=A0ABY8W3A9_9MYCO|nr:polysaccharide deacetylase family protein [Candidatus Mycobacterium wuenschmannii]WIM90046.1 polysaccharide deacetylase family protein [Candidatus Mycobacterium wuenschmannii]